MKILKRFTGEIIYENKKAKTLKDCVIDAVARGLNLRCSNLSGSNLRCSNLSDSNLSDSNLRRSNLSGSDLSGSDLSGSNLSDSNLSGSNLRGANLSYSNLSGSNLSYSNLSDSNLSDSNLRGADLFNAIGNNEEIKTIQTGGYIINIVESLNYIKIGCEQHTIKEWFNFADKEIIAMDGKNALIWWRKWKPILMSILEYKEK